MTLKLKLKIKKQEHNKYDGSLSFYHSNGAGCSVITIMENSPHDTINTLIDGLMNVTPNFMQREIDEYLKDARKPYQWHIFFRWWSYFRRRFSAPS